MGVFSATVPKEMYDDMKRARDIWQQECSALRIEMTELMKDLIAVKRHELGLPPAGVTMTDPASVLGKRTLAAIEDVSGGFADVKSHQTNYAIVQMQAGLAAERDPNELDAELAEHIRQGDEG